MKSLQKGIAFGVMSNEMECVGFMHADDPNEAGQISYRKVKRFSNKYPKISFFLKIF